MKKLFCFAAVLFAGFWSVQAQNEGATAKGSWLVEANTNFGTGHSANTGFQFASIDGESVWNIGGEAGYFVIDDLALKLGLGYGDTSFTDGAFSFKVGAKYYIASQFPIQLDLNGYSFDSFTPLFFGVQGGYALFLADNIALEPGIRYDLDINDEAAGQDTFAINLGFSLFF